MKSVASFARIIFQSALFFCIAVAIAQAQSQSTTGLIQGVVTDPDGASIAGARISIKNIDTGLVRDLTSDGAGDYRAPLLPLGNYTITVEADGFARLVREGIQLTIGQTLSLTM